MGFLSSKSKSSANQAQQGTTQGQELNAPGSPMNLSLNASSGDDGGNIKDLTIFNTVTDFGAVSAAFDVFESAQELGQSSIKSASILTNEVIRRDEVLTAQVVDLLGAQYDANTAVSDNSRASFQTVAGALNDSATNTSRILAGLENQSSNVWLWVAVAGGLALLVARRKR